MNIASGFHRPKGKRERERVLYYKATQSNYKNNSQGETKENEKGRKKKGNKKDLKR